MTGLAARSGVRRWLADFVLAFALFWLAAFCVGASHTRAHALQLPSLVNHATSVGADHLGSSEPNQAVQAVHRVQTSPDQALLLLSVAFAALAALNLGFWRHLRRAYASPRRSVWGRG